MTALARTGVTQASPLPENPDRYGQMTAPSPKYTFIAFGLVININEEYEKKC